jgi:hypothetical protein
MVASIALSSIYTGVNLNEQAKHWYGSRVVSGLNLARVTHYRDSSVAFWDPTVEFNNNSELLVLLLGVYAT